MYRATSELEAANLALGEIGEPPIGSLQDQSSRGRAIRQWYGTVLDATQREHDFGFCAAWFVPAMNPTPALGRLKYRFAMPDDCLKVRDVLPYRPSTTNYGSGISITDPNIIAELESAMTAPRGRAWDIEASSIANEAPIAAMVLVTNLQQPVVNITRRIHAVRLWDPIFTEAFAKNLGAAIAPQVARNISAAQEKASEANVKLEEAARTDSREQSPRHVSRETSWVRSRYIGSGYRDRRW